MRLNYGELWNEAVGLVRCNRSVVIALAGAFFFLPNLLVGYLAPMEPGGQGVSFIETVAAHVRANWPLILAGGLVEMLGTLVLLRLLLKSDGRTVGALIAASLALLPTMFVASIVSNMLIVIGLALLIVPGVYALGRLALVPAVIAAEQRRNPFDAIGRSFALTRNCGFAVAWIFVIVFVVAAVIDIALSGGLGSVAILLAGRDTGLLVAEAVGAVIWASASVLQIAIASRIYLRLTAAPTVPASG